MTLAPGPTTADATGARRLRMLRDRCRVIDEQVAELRDRKRLIRWEIVQIRIRGLVEWVQKSIEPFTNIHE